MLLVGLWFTEGIKGENKYGKNPKAKKTTPKKPLFSI